MAMVSFVRKELKNSLFAYKVPTKFQLFNTIAVQQEYNLIINIRCNGSIFKGISVDGGTDVNIMTILGIKYIDLEIKRPSSVTYKMADRKICKS